MPVPIELIIERTYGLSILWDDIDEPPGSTILGALSPKAKTILLNERHQELLEKVVGPYEFTLAHELGHWIYDVGDADQLELFAESTERFCYHRRNGGLAETLRIREMNANKLAASILMPASVMGGMEFDAVESDLRTRAQEWGVSQQALRIRLDVLRAAHETKKPGLLL